MIKFLKKKRVEHRNSKEIKKTSKNGDGSVPGLSEQAKEKKTKRKDIPRATPGMKEPQAYRISSHEILIRPPVRITDKGPRVRKMKVKIENTKGKELANFVVRGISDTVITAKDKRTYKVTMIAVDGHKNKSRKIVTIKKNEKAKKRRKKRTQSKPPPPPILPTTHHALQSDRVSVSSVVSTATLLSVQSRQMSRYALRSIDEHMEEEEVTWLLQQALESSLVLSAAGIGMPEEHVEVMVRSYEIDSEDEAEAQAGPSTSTTQTKAQAPKKDEMTQYMIPDSANEEDGATLVSARHEAAWAEHAESSEDEDFNVAGSASKDVLRAAGMTGLADTARSASSSDVSSGLSDLETAEYHGSSSEESYQLGDADEDVARIQDHLPQGWTAYRDSETDRIYYHNAGSGVVQWDPPYEPSTSLRTAEQVGHGMIPQRMVPLHLLQNSKTLCAVKTGADTPPNQTGPIVELYLPAHVLNELHLNSVPREIIKNNQDQDEEVGRMCIDAQELSRLQKDVVDAQLPPEFIPQTCQSAWTSIDISVLSATKKDRSFVPVYVRQDQLPMEMGGPVLQIASIQGDSIHLCRLFVPEEALFKLPQSSSHTRKIAALLPSSNGIRLSMKPAKIPFSAIIGPARTSTGPDTEDLYVPTKMLRRRGRDFAGVTIPTSDGLQMVSKVAVRKGSLQQSATSQELLPALQVHEGITREAARVFLPSEVVASLPLSTPEASLSVLVPVNSDPHVDVSDAIPAIDLIFNGLSFCGREYSISEEILTGAALTPTNGFVEVFIPSGFHYPHPSRPIVDVCALTVPTRALSASSIAIGGQDGSGLLAAYKPAAADTSTEGLPTTRKADGLEQAMIPIFINPVVLESCTSGHDSDLEMSVIYLPSGSNFSQVSNRGTASSPEKSPFADHLHIPKQLLGPDSCSAVPFEGSQAILIPTEVALENNICPLFPNTLRNSEDKCDWSQVYISTKQFTQSMRPVFGMEEPAESKQLSELYIPTRLMETATIKATPQRQVGIMVPTLELQRHGIAESARMGSVQDKAGVEAEVSMAYFDSEEIRKGARQQRSDTTDMTPIFIPSMVLTGRNAQTSRTSSRRFKSGVFQPVFIPAEEDLQCVYVPASNRSQHVE